MNGNAPLHIVVASRAVAPQHGFGGLERAVTHHLRALARRGVRLSVFTQPPHPDQPSPDNFGGMVTWHTIPYRRRQLPLRPNSIPDRLIHYAPFARTLGTAIIALCRQERVDIVHAHGLAGLGYAEGLRPPGPPILGGENSLAVSQASGEALTSPTPRSPQNGGTGGTLPPLVLNPHGLEEFSQRDRAKWLAYAPFRYGVRRVARAAARVIATDRALIEPIGRQLGVPAERIALIPNGVAPEEIGALVDQGLIGELSQRYGLGHSPLTLVSVARLERNKGLQEGIAALALLHYRLPRGWRWLIVGRGSEEAALRAAIAQAGFANNITLVGALPDAEVHSLLSRADLALVPSLYEGSSLAALEALTHRLPVVATTAGGLPDKILPGQTGFLANPGDSAAFANALAEALAARASWPTLGAAGRALVERQFSWDALADDYLTLYRQLIAPQH
jgi:glycogen(starch) synthase